jgi:hypothetical protein
MVRAVQFVFVHIKTLRQIKCPNHRPLPWKATASIYVTLHAIWQPFLHFIWRGCMGCWSLEKGSPYDNFAEIEH